MIPSMPDTPTPTSSLAHRVRGPNGVAQLTGWSPQFVYKLIDEGRLPAVHVGRSVTVMHDDLVAFLDAHREGGVAA